MLKVENLHKIFRTEEIETIALNGVSFEVNEGEFVAIMGPSGCGKSTLLNILGLLDNPTSGSYQLLGREVATLREKERTRYRKGNIGFVFQSFNLIDELNVFENVELPLIYLRVKASERKRRVNEMLSRMNISHRTEHFPQQLSGGQQQRVAIARSLVNEPEILLLDEPLGALDLKLRKEMQLELKRLQREMNITFIYVTHDQEEALTMSDTVVVMNGGKVQQIGTPEDIYNEPKNAFVADFIGDSNIVDGVMHKDFLVSFSGVDFPCVDRGFAREQSVQVVVRPEDIEVVSPVEGQLVGVVNDVIFKGVHFEMHVECEGREWLIHSTRACTPGETIGMRIGPNEIHIMARSEG
jgi:spermidine/putrescine transport system ATP-binding protein